MNLIPDAHIGGYLRSYGPHGKTPGGELLRKPMDLLVSCAIFTGKDFSNNFRRTGRDWGQEEKGTTEDEMAGWHH